MADSVERINKEEGKSLQEEVEEIWIDLCNLVDGPSAKIDLPEGMRAVEISPNTVILRAIMPGLPEDKFDMPVAVFGLHCRPEEVQKEAERIFEGIKQGKLKYREKSK